MWVESIATVVVAILWIGLFGIIRAGIAWMVKKYRGKHEKVHNDNRSGLCFFCRIRRQLDRTDNDI